VIRTVRKNTAQQGWREIGGKRNYYRSKWEANYARFLQLLQDQRKIKCWVHEPKTFWFEGIKRGVCSYKPDFGVTKNDDTMEYYEVKGYMDPKSATKIKRMKKYYPAEKVVLVGPKWFKENNNILKGVIKDWE
jgi:hypothetical protein